MHCRARSLFAVVVIALGTLSMIGACGQKGALYLADQEPPKPPALPKQQPASPGTPDAAADDAKPVDKDAAQPVLKWP